MAARASWSWRRTTIMSAPPIATRITPNMASCVDSVPVSARTGVDDEAVAAVAEVDAAVVWSRVTLVDVLALVLSAAVTR